MKSHNIDTRVMVHGPQFLDAVDTWNRSTEIQVDDYFDFDQVCGLKFLPNDSVNKKFCHQATPRYYVFEVVDRRAFTLACLKWGWTTKSYGDD